MPCLMTSKDRIKQCMDFEQADRIGIYDFILESTIEEWKRQGLPKEVEAKDFFGCDFEILPLGTSEVSRIDENRFVCLSVCEPFGRLSYELGLEEALKALSYDNRSVRAKLGKSLDAVLKQADSFLAEHGNKVDGAWIYGDLAYQKGLYFSLSLYKEKLLPLHRELSGFFKSRGLRIIFHSDGNIKELLPTFIGLGIGAVEPLESESGLDALELREEYGRDLALMGNIGFDKLKSSRGDLEKEIKKKIVALKKEGGYIYRMDKDITPDIRFDDYRFAIELVKRYGSL